MMKRTTAFVFWIALGSAFAGAADDLPRFEVASVKPSNPKETRHLQAMDMLRTVMPTGMGLGGHGTKVEAHDYTLEQLITTAYRVSKRQVIGPDWLSEKRFDVDAVMPAEMSSKQSNEMLQSLLQERFGLVAHRDTQEQAGYVLTVAKNGPNLKVSGPAPTQPGEPPTPESIAQRMRKHPAGSGSHYNYPRQTMQGFAELLSRLLQVPVEDRTGLTERYDVVLDIPPPLDADDRDPQSRTLDAVRKLGFNVKSEKIATPVVVIDSIQKSPTPN